MMAISYIFSKEELAVICSDNGRIRFIKAFVDDVSVSAKECDATRESLVKKGFYIKKGDGYSFDNTMKFVFKEMRNAKRIVVDKKSSFSAYICKKIVVCLMRDKNSGKVKITPLENEKELLSFTETENADDIVDYFF